MNGVVTHFVWDGMNMVYEYTDAESSSYIYGTTGILYRKDSAGEVYTYTTSGRGDVVTVADSDGNAREYFYNAYGEIFRAFGAEPENPLLYCGEYYDAESGFIYLRNRYYEPSIGRFITEDPVRDGTNWYVYCENNPVMYTDPTGHLREAGYVYGIWCEDPDACEFNEDSGTYKILVQLGKRWEQDVNSRQATAQLAEKVRRLARERTPVKYAQNEIINELHSDVSWAKEMFAKYLDPNDRYLILVQRFYDAEGWNYKWKDEWRVPYATYDWVGDGSLVNMNLKTKSHLLDFEGSFPKNWVPWLYFDGVVISAADMGNLATGYVMASMGYDSREYHAWNDKVGDNDWLWVEYGANMALKGR